MANLNRQYPHLTKLALCIVLWLLGVLLAVVPAHAQTPPQDIPASYALVADNETFELYLDSATLAFKLRDKRSGYLWHSGVDEKLEEDRLNRSWLAFAQSGFSIEYLDNRAINERTSIANTEHTLDITAIDQGVSAQVTFTELGISFTVIVQLEAEGVRVEIPATSVSETSPDYRLGQIYVYPFLGAARGSSIDGYMLVPDGTGSLIRFADTTRAQNMFYGRYYGEDLGMIAEMPYDPLVTNPAPIGYPVFGMVHGAGENAFISIVERGAAYGELQVHPAGIITNFNFLYTSFIYAEPYFQATNRSGAGVTIVQRNRNNFDAVVHFRFLTGAEADYVGMAHSYQQYLVENGRLHPFSESNPNIGLRLEVLGGDKEQVLFWNRFVPMTTISQIGDILNGLQVPNPEVIYYGWQPYGAATMPPTTLVMEGGLGSVGDLANLTDQIAANGGHLSLYLDPQMAYFRESGYTARTDLAMAITNIDTEGFNRTYGSYFTLEVLSQRLNSLSNDMAARVNTGLAIDGMSWMLYGDFRSSAPLNREEAIDAYQSLLSETPQRLGMYRPNDYFFGLTQAYYDMPIGDNGYIYTSESVPFLPIVLAGYMPYYGTALNFSSDQQGDLLRHVEFGIYPSYFITQEPTANILNTRSNWIYTSSYEQWGDEIRTTYQWLNALLAPVRGQAITAHTQLATGVFATTYANGQQIIVNYTDQLYVNGATVVPAQDALLVEASL